MPKLANSKVNSARTTVPADAEIDSPTRATARDTARSPPGRPQAFSDAEHEEQPVVGPAPRMRTISSNW